MELYLMQHGTCFSKEVDPDQPLSPVGMEQIARSARAVRRLGLGFDVIISSPKTRALQTAEAVAAEVGYPASEIIVSDTLKAMTPPADSTAFLKSFADREAVFVTGHLPNLAELASHLITPGPKARIGLENGGLCRIDLPSLPTREGVLRWCLSPFHLQIIAGS